MSAFRKDIGGLRALSVIAVLLFHFKVPGFSGGFVGVDIFFVISGYLMTQIITGRIEKGKFSFQEFFLARAFRILPALYFLLLILLLIGFLFVPPFDYRSLSHSSVAAATFLSNVLFWGQAGYFQDASEENWLLHTWSLSVEWQFYVLYPFALVVACKLGLRNRLPQLISVALILSFATAIILGEIRPTIGFYSLPSRCWELLAGGLCVYVAPLQEAKARLLQAAGLLIIACCILLLHDIPSYPSFWAAAPVLGATIVLCARRDCSLLSNPVSQWIGNISYSLYLWHWPTITVARYFELDVSGWNAVWLIILSVVLAQASYSLVERSLNSSSVRGLRISTLSMLIGAGSIIIAAGIIIQSKQGLPARADEPDRQLVGENELLSDDWMYPENCRKNFLRSFSGDDDLLAICSVNDSDSEVRVRHLFWGDSLMEQLYPALRKIEESSDGSYAISMVTSGGCIPVRGLNRTAAGYHCNEFNERAFQLANGDGFRAHTVVLGGSWLRNLLGVNGSGPLVCRVEGDGCRGFSSSDEALAYVQVQLIRDVKDMLAGGRRVIIVLPFPVQPVDVSKHLARRLFLGHRENVMVSRTDFQSLASPVTKMLTNVSDATGAQLWNPVEALCTPSECKGEKDMVALYRDRYHMTSSTAIEIAPAIAGAISR